jgi:hypothetical protein
MDDLWELYHGLIVGIDDGALDPDFDNQSNVAEYKAGTSPRDARNYLELELNETPGGLSIDFKAAPNISYTIEYSDSLLPPITWTKLQQVSPDSMEREISIAVDPTEIRRFYRLIITPVP